MRIQTPDTNKTLPQKMIAELCRLQPTTQDALAVFLRGAAKNYGLSIPTNAVLRKEVLTYSKSQNIVLRQTFLDTLKRRKIRSLSGVAVLTVLTKPYPCPGKCVYCPTEKGMPKSYLSNEPAAMRAARTQFDPFRQIEVRLEALARNGHPTDKLELIVLGGTWSSYKKSYQTWFIKRCFDACNGTNALSLAAAKKKNESAQHRIIGLSLETRPDWITPAEVARMRKLGATRVDLGIQHTDNAILQLIRRDMKREDMIRAIELLRDAGFKVSLHVMPDLPGSTPKKDLAMFQELFNNPDWQPDWLKIYPCAVIESALLYHWWKKGAYKPYPETTLFNLLLEAKKLVPPWVRVTRLIRDIPSESIVAGNRITNLREALQEELGKQGIACRCIRCREARGRTVTFRRAKLTTHMYRAGFGTEYFLSYTSKNEKILYAFVRLRLSEALDTIMTHALPELKGAALIRELHTYGKLVSIAAKSTKGAPQHQGFGKKLMAEAERIARENGYKKMAVISGIGVRAYYRKLGYRLQGEYMCKHLVRN